MSDFTYFEGYHPRVWDGLVRRGFVRNMTGLRFCQNLLLPDELKFNTLAAPGGEFDRIQCALDCPVYIDRLQGGCYIDTYPYDERLLADYRARLGEKFWGFQMHEWMSNYRTDIEKLHRENCPSWTAPAIERTIRAAYPVKFLFLEAMTAPEMAALGQPSTADEFYAQARWLLERRMADHGELIPCDSGYLAFKLELDTARAYFPHRIHRIMPEVGAQTPNSRLQIGYARSMAKAYGAEFGVYYEPWGGSPFSACCYNRVATDNEWGIGRPDDFPFQTCGPNGGSSRSLQARIHLYGYFAGASFMSEEWGMCNTFLDWQNCEVSPYGQVKLDFLNFAETYPDRGRQLTPVAVVLPSDMTVIDGLPASEDRFGYPLPAAEGDALRKIREGIACIFANPTPMCGTEAHALINSDLPDAFDLIHADAPTLGDYDYLVDLSGGQIPAVWRDRIIPLEQALPRAMASLPCTVTGGVHWMVNACSDEGYYLIIFNHSGVMRTVDRGEYTLPEATATAEVTIRSGRELTRLEGSSAITRIGNRYMLSIEPGGWFFGKF